MTERNDRRDEADSGLNPNNFYPGPFCEKERELLARRRRKALESEGVAKGRLEGAAIGVACSGGGIRSATFCLGFFQGLAKLRSRHGKRLHLLKHLDILSTVSGGGYFGGFLGRLITRGAAEGSTGVERAERVLENSHSDEVTWLRNHGRYISPTGAGDSLVAVAVFLRNWLTLHVVLGAAFLLLFLAANTVRSLLWDLGPWKSFEAVLHQSAARGLWWSPSIGLVGGLLVVAVLPLGWAYWLAQRDPTTARSHTPLIATVIVVLTGIFLLDLADQFGLEGFHGLEVVLIPVVFLTAIVVAFCLLRFFKRLEFGQFWFRAAALSILVLEAVVLYLVIRTEFFRQRIMGTYLHEETFTAAWVIVLFAVTALVGLSAAWRVEMLEKEIRRLKKAEFESGRNDPAIEGLTRRQAATALGALAVGAALVVSYVGLALRGNATLDVLVRDLGGSGFAISAAVVCTAAALALVYWILATQFAMVRSPGDPEGSVRNYLSIWLSRALVVGGCVLAFCLVDSVGQSLWALQVTGGGKLVFAVLSSVVAGAAGLATVARTLADLLIGGARGEAGSRFRMPWNALAAVASFVLWSSLMVLYATVSHAVLWRAEAPSQSLGLTIARAWKAPSVISMLRVEDDGRVGVERPGAPGELAEGRGPDAAGGDGDGLGDPRDAQGMVVMLGLAAGLLCLVSMNLRFVNFSSHQSLYAARLTRAYLGASNPRRRQAEGRKVSQSIEGDDLLFDSYYRPHEEGGPLHLLSVTINETIDGRSQIEQRDRKGLPMSLGPVGMSAGLRYHARWKPETAESHSALEISWDKPEHTTRHWVEIEPIELADAWCHDPDRPEDHHDCFHVFRARAHDAAQLVERLTLGGWLSISGAAFSTGLGAKTSLGVSSLMGFINVRLGYWWDSGINPADRDDFSTKGLVNRLSLGFARVFPAHAYLLDEMLARFRGPNRRRWYLSDGGHFENTGCYELLRRRVPMIVVLDCGADPSYDFADLANLVRKARVDFGAEIRFLSQQEINKHVDPDINKYFGTPAQIRRQARELKDEDENEIFHGRSYSRKHAALAQVWFPGDADDAPTSEILWIKPSMVGDEPIDLRNYHGKNSAFPQETTADQFFDEAQWESYRKLGERIAERLFYDDPAPEESWTPLRWFERKRKLDTFVNPVGTGETRKRDIKSQP